MTCSPAASVTIAKKQRVSAKNKRVNVRKTNAYAPRIGTECCT